MDIWVVSAFLPTLNNTAMNIGVQVSIWELAFNLGGMYLEVESPDHMVILYLTFWWTSTLCSIAAIPFYIPTSNAPESNFSASLSTLFLVTIIVFLVCMKWDLIVVLCFF